jgi:hypothetical protein
VNALVHIRTTIAQYEDTIVGIGGMAQRGQHDATGDDSAHNQRVDAVRSEDHIEIRIHEGADPALGDDYLIRRWRDTGMNVRGYAHPRFERAEDLVVRANFGKSGPECDRSL